MSFSNKIDINMQSLKINEIEDDNSFARDYEKYRLNTIALKELLKVKSLF